MKLDNYKNIKKSEWQLIANNFGIEYEKNSGVRYLLEKIAEKIGVDYKIVSDNELKKKVVEKINFDYEVVPVEQEILEKPKKATNKKFSEQKEPVIKKVKQVKEEEIISNEQPLEESTKKEIPIIQLSRIEQLRLECEAYGIAWAEGHSESNLEQVLNGVKNAGIQPIKEIPTSIIPIQPALNTNEAFEINSENANEIAKSLEKVVKYNFAFNPFSTPPAPPVFGGYKNSNSYLDTYRNIYNNAIRNHWRVLSVAEINEMIIRDKQKFNHQVNLHPQQQNKAEIILTQGDCAVRIPSDNNNEWIDING